MLCALGFGFWTLQASHLSSTALAPRTAPATPQLAGWVGFCIGNHEPSRAPKGPIRLVVTYAAWSGDARASERRPHGQLILVRRKFELRRLSHGWAGQEQKRLGQLANPPLSLYLESENPVPGLTNQSTNKQDRGCYDSPYPSRPMGGRDNRDAINPYRTSVKQLVYPAPTYRQAVAAAAAATAATAGTLLQWGEGREQVNRRGQDLRACRGQMATS